MRITLVLSAIKLTRSGSPGGPDVYGRSEMIEC